MQDLNKPCDDFSVKHQVVAHASPDTAVSCQAAGPGQADL